MHLTIGIFGEVEQANELAKKLGKAGTRNDIAIYNHASSEGVFTYICPNSDRIQSLMQSLNMIDIPVLLVSSLTKEIGEIIIAMDEMNFEKGFIIADQQSRESLIPMIKGTSLERFTFTDESSIRVDIINYRMERKGGDLLVPIDNYFNVKSVGTVILGIIKSGSVKKYDKVMMEPTGREVLVKGIQSQDKDLESAESGMRVGLSLKGIEADEIRRGFVICRSMKKTSEIKMKLKKSRFCRQELKPGIQISVSCGLQFITCMIESMEGDIIKLKTVSPVAYTEGQKIILASQGESLPRIIGSGII